MKAQEYYEVEIKDIDYKIERLSHFTALQQKQRMVIEHLKNSSMTAEQSQLKRFCQTIKEDMLLSFYDDVVKMLKDDLFAPSGSGTKVVRCENCKHAYFRYNTERYPFGLYACKKQPTGRTYKKVRGDFFCAYGEEDENNG